MLVRTQRVKSIVNFVNTMCIADSIQLSRVFYPHQIENCQKKMCNIIRYNLLKRKRTFLGTRYIYYNNKFPIQFEHKYLLTELYTRFCEKYGVNNCTCECEFTGIDGMRPDGFITIKNSGYKYLFFVEIHISNNDFNYQKYFGVYKEKKHIHITQDAFVFPIILVVTDSNIVNNSDLEFIKIDTEFSNLDMVIDDIIKGA